jgi:GNAT superfamily N-acetyltransferase
MDHFEQMGALALGSRLRRLSDRLMEQVSDVYRENDVFFRPRWFPLFQVIANHSCISVTEAAARLGVTHAAVSQLAKEMAAAGLLELGKSQADARSTELKISTKGSTQAKRLKPLWDRIKTAVSLVVEDTPPSFLDSLKRIEDEFERKSILARLAKDKEPVEIIDFHPRLKKEFRDLNVEWLEKYFRIEKGDEEFFSDPKGKIIDPGGHIYFARAGKRIVGTCALLRESADRFELTKMAVTEGFQGRQVGRRLLEHAIRQAKLNGAKSVFLLSNTKLQRAIQLYKKMGFHITHEGPHPKYRRTNILMEKNL